MRSWLAALVFLSACGVRSASPTPSRAPGRTPGFSWTATRQAARAAREAHDYISYRRQLEVLFARSGSPWVLVDFARADVLLEDRPRALADLRAFARTGFFYDVAGDEKLAPLRSDTSFAALLAQLATNQQPVAHARPAFALPHADLVTEDIAYDAKTKTFFVSSVRHRKILAIGPDGQARDLVAESAQTESLLALAFGGGRLWATTAAMPPMVGYDAHPPNGRAATALLAFDPGDGTLLERIELPSATGEHALTDLAIGPTGELFVSDSAGGALYTLAPGSATLAPLAGPDELVSPQTPAPSADGKRIFVPDYVRGIAVIDLASHALSWLGHADDVGLAGIDGLYVDGSSLLAVQNGAAPPRVARFTLSSDGTSVARAEVLERATPGLGEPTHGVIAEGAFYFLANAGWNRFDDDGHLLTSGTNGASVPPDAPAIWRLPR